MSHQCKHLQLIPLIISFQKMLVSTTYCSKKLSAATGTKEEFFLKWVVGKTLLNSHQMTWFWGIKIFTSLEILLPGYWGIMMHLKMSISIYDQFVSEPDIPTSITLGLMYQLKCSSRFNNCTFRDYHLSFIGAHEIHISYFWNFFQDQILYSWLSFHDHFYLRVKFFGFWDMFDVSCTIILIRQICLRSGFS